MSQVSIAGSRFVSSPTTAALGGGRFRFPSVGIVGNSSSSLRKPPAHGKGSRGGAGGGGGGVIAPGSGDADSAAAVSIGQATGMGLSQDLTGLHGASAGAGAGAAGPGGGSGGEDDDERPRLNSDFSEAVPSEAAFSEAASRYHDPAPGGRGGRRSAGPVGVGIGTGLHSNRPAGLDMYELETPNSAAGSRFDTASSPGSAMTFASRVGVESPTAAAARAAALRGGNGGGRGGFGGGGGGGGLLTGRSAASSMRSDAESSFFRGGSALSAAGSSQRSVDSRGRLKSSASTTSWDEEDLQNMGTRWLADRAYNQQFDEKK